MKADESGSCAVVAHVLHQFAEARARLDDDTYRRARHVVTEDQRVLDTVQALRAQLPEEVGRLLTASHRSMRDDFEISTKELDAAVETEAVTCDRSRSLPIT